MFGWGFFERLRKEDHANPPSEGIEDIDLNEEQLQAMEEGFHDWLIWRDRERKRR